MPTVPSPFRPPVRARCTRVGGARTHEAAFTLIEVVIAAVLLAIVLAVGTVGIVNSIGGGSHAVAGSSVDAAMARAGVMFQDDVQRAVTADRRDNLLRDPAELQRALQRNAPAYSSDPSDPRLLDIDDVVTATPTRMQLRADVHANPGVECVTWQATEPRGTNQLRVTRSVGPSCARFDALGSQVMFASQIDSNDVVNRRPFSYRLMCHRTQCIGAPSGVSCRAWMDANPAARQLRWILGAEAAFTSISTDRSATNGNATVRGSIRSRESDTYHRGLGC